ncbi:MAG TPA: TonB-dependent receptor [Allosphingosinicella sp.]|jgi:TonB-dependent receptor
MRLKSFVLSTSSIAVLAFAATPAAAQTDQPEEVPATAEAQEAPQDTDATGQTGTDAAEGEAIVVTGLRASLRSSQNIKRNSEQIVDSIVAEDIGKLPDIAVSDTAARIPGVQVERSGGEASRVLVRGLPDFTTTYNGREIFTAETRLVALQDFPSGGIGAIEVFKTSTANLVEGGLAGLVNVRSRRPFDFREGQIAGSIWALYPRGSGDVTPNGNLLITDRWDTGMGEIGVLLNASYTRLHFLDSERSNTDFVAPGPAGSRFPDIQRLTFREGDRTRPSVNGAIQWRPSPGLEFYVEGLWQGFRNRVSDREMEAALWGAENYTNLVFREGSTNLLYSGTAVNPARPPLGFQGGTFNKTDTYQFAVGGSWDSGPLRVSGDVARTDSTFTGSTASVDYILANRQTIDFVTDVPGGDAGPTFNLRNFDASDPAQYLYRGFYEEAQQATGQDWQARLDVQYEIEGTVLNRIEAGARFVDRDAHREFGNRYWNFEGARRPISEVPLDYELFRAGFRGDDVQQLRTFLSPTYRSIRDNLVELRQYNMNLGGTAFGPNTLDAPTPDPRQTFDASEQSMAGYVQAHYEFDVGGATIDGAIGVRAVKTRLQVAGTSLVEGVATPVSIQREYSDWLPNFSARVRFSPEVQLRLSATQTRTRPSFRDYNPAFTVGQIEGCPPGDPDNPQCFRSGEGGNPDIRRLTSNNYDASLEYFFSRTGFASITAFRRDLNGFIETEEQRFSDPTLGNLRIRRPINSGAGRIGGFEAQVTTFFDFEGMPQLVRNFGVQANLTHLVASADFQEFNGDASTTVNRRLLGVSKWSYNLVGMYEGGGLSVRLSYNHRSPFLITYQRRQDFTGRYLYQEESEPTSRLDLSTSYNVTEAFTVFFDWTNILANPFRSNLIRQDRTDAGVDVGDPFRFPRITRFEETIFSAGVRFRF